MGSVFKSITEEPAREVMKPLDQHAGSGERPIVSVILATYNRKKFIPDCVRSVLIQTYSDFELIIVDDGSTDETRDIIGQYKDPRLKYHYQENRGRSAARNQALDMAQGDLITFIDSDDVYLPDKLQKQVDYFISYPEAQVLYTGAQGINSEGKPINKKFIASQSGDLYSSIAFFRGLPIALPTVMVRARLMQKVGGFDETLHRFEDTDLWRRLSKHATFHALPEDTCLIRTHDDNSLATQDPRAIIAALKLYTDKIMREDVDKSAYQRGAGVLRLYLHYARAFWRVPAWRLSGAQLAIQGLVRGLLSLRCIRT